MVEVFPEYDNKSPNELNNILHDIESSLVNNRMIVTVEKEKMEKYRVNFLFY